MNQTRLGSLIEACTCCGKQTPIASRGMCQPCYKKWLRDTPKDDRPSVDRGSWRPRRFKSATCGHGGRDRGNGMCSACYARWYRQQNKEKLREQSNRKHLMRKFGITPEQKEDMRTQQNGRCAICGSEPYENSPDLHVDHCHTTGKVRGLLCARCNWYLGKIDADPSIIDRIIAYRSNT